MDKTALVLSGGGMFGAYQAGAWQALSRHITPDLVVGVSVGALNGWCIACGMPAAENVGNWLDPDVAGIMRYRIPPMPWRGVFDPRPLEMRARHLTESLTPVIDYGVVVLEVPGFRARLFTGREVTWRHLVASCAVPGGFPPLRIGNRLYCDGGVLEQVPLWAAAKMGATRAIVLNALRFVPPVVVRILMRSLRFAASRRVHALVPLDVVTISPRQILGTLRDGGRWQPDKIRTWIRMGEEDAEAAVASGALAGFAAQKTCSL